MKLRTRLGWSVAVALATSAASALAVAGAARHLEASSATADRAERLQRRVLQRAIVLDEFLLYGEPRQKAQWGEESDVLAQLLAEAGRVLPDEGGQRLVETMARSVDESRRTFEALVRAQEEPPAGGARAGAALRERLTSDLLLSSHELSDGAHRLAVAAARQERSARRALLLVVAATVLALLALMVASAFLTTGILRQRIARLEEGAGRIAAGDLAHRIRLSGDDELAELARTFDAMAARVQEGRALLEGSNRELEAFSYSVSHDLRAPLRHVVGFVNLLGERARGTLDAKSVHYLEVIGGAAQKMGQLIDDLLLFSRMGRAELKQARLDPRPMVEAVIEELAPEAEGRQVVWQVGALPEVSADPAMLRQVWANLLGNALKFTGPRTPARIEVGAEAGPASEVRFFVKDNGVGFDMRFADKLFGVFQRLHRSGQFEGTGVGLANVQRIVHRHGGRVGAESVLDAGATFWFTLPGKDGAS